MIAKKIELSNKCQKINKMYLKNKRNAGGAIMYGRVCGVLAITRAFGDH
jgi:hypothetical protein